MRLTVAGCNSNREIIYHKRPSCAARLGVILRTGPVLTVPAKYPTACNARLRGDRHISKYKNFF
jgi:hypothetical protein